MQTVKELLSQFPRDLYDTDDNRTSLYTLVSALLASCDQAEKKVIQTFLDTRITTAKYGALDGIYGKVFDLFRLENETYSFSDPSNQSLSACERAEIVIKDNRYRSRIISFLEAMNIGPTKEGIKKAVSAATGLNSFAIENYLYGSGVKDPTGKYEFTIKLDIDNYLEQTNLSYSASEYSLFKKIREDRIRSVVSKLKPATTVFIVDDVGVAAESQINPVSITSSSDHQMEIYTENYVRKLRSVSSELIRESVSGDLARSVVTTSTYTTTIELPIAYSATGNVPAALSGRDSEAVYGHWPGEAFDRNEGTYWLSTSDDSPNEVYSYEYIQGDTGYNYLNQIRFRPVVGNMHVFVSLHDGNNWLGGAIIPYQGYVAYIYPTGEQWDCGARVPYVSERDLPNSTDWQIIDIPAGNYKYARLTFTNLQNFGLPPYPYRAGVYEFRVYNTNYASTNPNSVIDGNEETYWISAANTTPYVDLRFEDWRNVDRLEIKTDTGVAYKITNLGESYINKEEILIQGTTTQSKQYINFAKKWCTGLRIAFDNLNNHEEGKTLHLYQLRAYEVNLYKDYPGTNLINRKKDDIWVSKVHSGIGIPVGESFISARAQVRRDVPTPQTGTETVEIYLDEDESITKTINRATVYNYFDGYDIALRAWVNNTWRLLGQKPDCPKVYEFQFEDVTTNVIQIIIQNLKYFKGSFGLNYIDGYIAALSEIQAFRYYTTSVWNAEKVTDSDDYSFWLSRGKESSVEEEWLQLDFANKTQLTKVFLNPVTYGLDTKLYITSDGTNWYQKYHDFSLTKESLVFDKTAVKAIKLVFTNLQPADIPYYEIADPSVLQDQPIKKNLYHAGMKTVSFFDTRYLNFDVSEISESFATKPPEKGL